MGNILKEVFQVGIPFLLRALTPLHPGSGSRVSGIVDLPVQREAHTDLPVIYGSSLKGALRSWAKARNIGDVERIFGPELGRGHEGMGKAVFTDAKLLFLPVRSLKGVYGWVTSPFLLQRFARDMKVVEELTEKGAVSIELGDIDVSDNQALGTGNNTLRFDLDGRDSVVLEDMILEFREKRFTFLETFGSLKEELEKRLVIVSHDVFKSLMRRALEIVPHIAINDETGTVDNLWYQENLPAESVLYSIAFTSEEMKEKLAGLLQGTIHVGGDITTGLGFAKIIRLG